MPKSFGESSREQNWGDAGDFRLESGDYRDPTTLDQVFEQTS